MLLVMERKSSTIRRARHRFARPANVFSERESLRTVPGDEAFGATRLLGNSEGGSAPLPNLPPETGCAGRAGARSGTSTGRGISRAHLAFYSGGLLGPRRRRGPRKSAQRRLERLERARHIL